MIRAAAAALVLTVIGGPAAAEIVSRGADGFILRFSVDMETTPGDVLASVEALPDWWDPAHTYTGDGTNLSLAFQPGGCWCERLADGTMFEHARVVSIEPAQVVMTAPLGPLHGKATRSDLVFSTRPENRGWRVAMDFVVEGPGLGAMADGVNAVMAGGFDRLIHHVEYGEPLPAD